MLPYARQVLELEKIAKLEGREPLQARDPLPLSTAEASAVCLVCERPATGTCTSCRSVSYCTREHQWVDSIWHGAACEGLREMREDASLRQRLSPALLTARLLERTRRGGRSAPSDWEELLAEGPALEPAERRVLSDLGSRPLSLVRVLARSTWARARESSLRAHVVAASAKDLEAPALYDELRFACSAPVELSFVGPELPVLALEDSNSTRFSLRTAVYRQALWPELGRPDVIVAYNAGFLIYPSWKDTLLELRGCGVPLVVTSYRLWEARAEAELLTSLGATLLEAPAENPFSSLAWRRSGTIANDMSRDNAYVSVWRL